MTYEGFKVRPVLPGSRLQRARPLGHAQPVADGQEHPESGSRGVRLRVGLFAGFAVAYGSWLVLGVVDNLVWMPRLIAPSTPLAQIYSVLADAGSAPGVVIAPVLWFLFWEVAGLVYLGIFLPVHRVFRRVAASMSAMSVLGIGLALFGAMAFFEWISGFGMGMEVSDELPPYVGNTTPFGLFCFTGGALIALIGGALWLIGTLRAGRSPVATDG